MAAHVRELPREDQRIQSDSRKIVEKDCSYVAYWSRVAAIRTPANREKIIKIYPYVNIYTLSYRKFVLKGIILIVLLLTEILSRANTQIR